MALPALASAQPTGGDTTADPPTVAAAATPTVDPAPSSNDPPNDDTPATGTPARAARREPAVHMFTTADDRNERARMRTAAARRRVPGEPEVLELTGMPDAYFFRSGVGGRSRVFVYMHSRGSSPRETCKQFAPVVTRFGWLVCPVGPGRRSEGHHVWNNNATVARRYAVEAVNALFRRFPRRARVTDNVIMGFSEGAFVAMQTGLYEPMMFPRWLIFAAHDAYLDADTGQYTNARRWLRREYLITGEHDEIVARTRRAHARLQRERLGRVEMRILPGASHELPPTFVPTVRRALMWLTR
jgi:predicted esterase